ncbi:MAG: two-component regulator propeller domain-containing protein [bacterium]
MTVPLDMPVLTPTALHEDRQGSLWLGTREKGLYRFDRAGAATVVLAQQTILNITEDREGTLWVGTRGSGLSQLKPRTAELLATGTGFPSGGVCSVCQDVDGRLWAVIWPNGEIMRSAGQDWSSLTASVGGSVPNAKCVDADPKGGVWIVTQDSGLCRWRDGAVTEQFSGTNGLVTGHISALRVTGSGAVWIGTSLVWRETGTGMSEERPQVLQCLEDKKFQTFSLPPGSGPVAALTTDAAGDCWAATRAAPRRSPNTGTSEGE